MASNQDTDDASSLISSKAHTSSGSSSSSEPISFGSPDPSVDYPDPIGLESEYAIFGVLGSNAGADRSFLSSLRPTHLTWIEQIFTSCGLALLTPEITAILKYKCLKYGPTVISEPPPHGTPCPKRKEGREDELIYQRCNTCETSYGQYTLCDHESDDGDYDKTVYTDRIGEHLKSISINDGDDGELPKSIVEIEYEMLHPGNLSKLLTINTDKHVTQYVAFTTHGTLLGYSDSIIIKKARKIASLAGLTWRSNSRALTNGDPLPTGVLPTLSTVPDKTGNLKSITLEIDNAVTSVCIVKETIVIAAVLILDVPKIDPDRSTQTPKGPPLTATATTASTNQDPDPSPPPPDPENPLPTSPTTSSSPLAQQQDHHQDQAHPSAEEPTKGKSKDGESDPPPPPHPQPTAQQLKILSWRTEAMASVLRDDLADFKMPDGVF